MERDAMTNVIKRFVKVKRKNGLEIMIGMDVEIINQVNMKQNKRRRDDFKKIGLYQYLIKIQMKLLEVMVYIK